MIAAQLPLKVSQFPKKTVTFGETCETTWADFTSQLSHRRQGAKDGPAFVTATFRPEPDGRVRRRSANLISRTAIALDIETNTKTGEVPPPVEEAADHVRRQGWTAVLYTSHSHTPDRPRYRIVLPLSREIDPTLPSVEVIADRLGLLAPTSLFRIT
jgi:putative DNA primase/helicase